MVFIFIIFYFLLKGERFGYTYYDERHGDIWKSIEALDRQVIFKIKVNKFNTIKKTFFKIREWH